MIGCDEMNNRKRMQNVAAATTIAAASLLFIWHFRDLDTGKESAVNEQTAALLSQRASAYTSEDVYEQRAQLKEEQEQKEQAQQPPAPAVPAPPANDTPQTQPQTLAERFSGTLVIGDSIAEGLLVYDVLNEAECIGVRGLRVDQLGQYMDEIARRYPSVLFLEFGMNDLEYWQGNAERFASVYQEQLSALRSRFPQMRIYVNSVLPISQEAIAQTPANGSWQAYNDALVQLCAQAGVTYIDNGNILMSLAQPFEQDGIHPRPDYYPLWAQHMADSAGLPEAS